MSKVQLAGNASGTGIFTIASPNSNTDRTLTLPDNTGTLLTSGSSLTRAQMPSGSVIQTVNATHLSPTTTTSTSFVATGLTASITPTSSSSKILILISTTTWLQTDTNDYIVVTIYRNSTNLGGGSFSAITLNSGARAATYDTTCTISYVDSPSTTSSTTYTMYIRSANGTGASANDSSNTNSITLLEIAG